MTQPRYLKIGDVVTDDPFDTPATTDPQSGKDKADARSVVIGGRYRLPDPDPDAEDPAYKRIAKDRGTRTETSWMRSTRLAGAISDGFSLSLWSQRMVARGLALRPGLVTLAASMDPDKDKDELNALCERAKDAAQANIGSDLGTAIHAFTEQTDMGENPYVPKQYRPHVDAWVATLKRFNLTVITQYTERVIINKALGVAGRIDRIVRVNEDIVIHFKHFSLTIKAGTLIVVDLKTGRDLQWSWDDIAIQQAVYNHMDAVWDWEDGYEPRPPNLTKDVAFITHIPVGTANPTLYAVDTRRGRKGADLASQVLQWQSQSDLAAQPQTPTDAARTQRAARISALLVAIQHSGSVAELRALYNGAVPLGLWTGEVKTAGEKRHNEIRQRS